jgi:HlyD family secretion protein
VRAVDTRTLYVLADGKPAARQVTVGITDGRVTEITGGELKEGENVIVSMGGPQAQRAPGQGQGQRGFRIL